MKIGTYLVAKNEQDHICRVIRYHLDIQQIDFVLLVDNGSTDHTVRNASALHDPRVIIKRTMADTGYLQHTLSTMAARELFTSCNCDWVLPVDADEYWHSTTFGTVRKALENIADPGPGCSTSEYRFFESARDNQEERLFLRRLLHARITGSRKVIMHGLGESAFEIAFGNHSFKLSGGIEPSFHLMPPADLARFHYPHISKKDLIKRTLNQVEGFLISTKGMWLQKNPENRLGVHAWNRYAKIRAGAADDEYYKNLFLSEEQLEKELPDNSVHYVDAMLRTFSPDDS